MPPTNKLVAPCRESLNMEINSFKNQHERFFDKKLRDRENIFYKFARCEHLLSLYNDCAQEEPLYIPKKFRSDKFHIRSEKERSVLTKMEIQRFQTECELLRIRRDDFTKKLFDIDLEIEKFISNSKLSAEAQVSIGKRWNKLINEDITRINNKWSKKIKSVTSAFETDKLSLKKTQKKRISDSNATNINQTVTPSHQVSASHVNSTPTSITTSLLPSTTLDAATAPPSTGMLDSTSS